MYTTKQRLLNEATWSFMSKRFQCQAAFKLLYNWLQTFKRKLIVAEASVFFYCETNCEAGN